MACPCQEEKTSIIVKLGGEKCNEDYMLKLKKKKYILTIFKKNKASIQP